MLKAKANANAWEKRCLNFKNGMCLGSPIRLPRLVEGNEPWKQYYRAVRDRKTADRLPHRRQRCGRCGRPLSWPGRAASSTCATCGHVHSAYPLEPAKPIPPFIEPPTALEVLDEALRESSGLLVPAVKTGLPCPIGTPGARCAVLDAVIGPQPSKTSRTCGCGAPLAKGKRMCDACAKNRRRESYRRSKHKSRSYVHS